MVDGVTSTYAYNGDGLRVSRTVDGATTDYVWDVGSALPVILQETAGGGTTYYVYGLDLISQIDGAGNEEYFLYDGLGSTRQLAGNSGDVVATYEYDVFGALRAQTGSADTAFRYTGEQWDEETGFYYLRARYYDPAIGRFVSKDPIPFIQRYAYVGSNPVNWVDPYGLWCPPGAGWACDKAGDLGEAAGGAAQSAGEALGEAWPYVSYGIQVADILPLANVPVFGQVGGQILDILAFVAAEIDIVRSGCPWQPLTVVNLSNLVVGTLGNLGGPLTVNQTSLVEAVITGGSAGFATGCDNIAYAPASGADAPASGGKE